METVKAPAEWFTGDVYIDVVAVPAPPARAAAANVHFTPGARTAWHSHAIAQTLHVTEGEGRVQSRGEPVRRIRPGDIVSISGEEWHWHGAAPDHFMAHLAFTEGDTEWGDHLTDDEYPGES
jgi:quercetin dioxygenase-like cupin family protein